MERWACRNLTMTAIWLAVFFVGLLIAFKGDQVRYDMLGLVICVYSAYAAAIHYLGVVVSRFKIYFPIPLIPSLPLFVIGRIQLDLGEIESVRSLGRWFGFEAVDVRSRYTWRILFPDRKARLDFLTAMDAAQPGIYIYRSRRRN